MVNTRKRRIGVALAAVLTLATLLALVPGVLRAWWVKGHETITEAAAAGLPEEVPAFFRAGGKELAHFAGDPDRWKNKANKFAPSTEGPNHFLDAEDLDGNELPPTRFEAMSLISRKLNRDPAKVGLLPYAILEGYEKLSCAFYDHRQDAKNPAVPMKCLVYAGNLAHYTTDASMPLHNTRDYDGRKEGGKFVQKGIHARLDGFPEKHGIKPEEVARGLTAKKIDDPWKHVLAFLAASQKEVPKAYELDAAGAFEKPTDESRAFVLERCRAGAQLTMDLWYTAWLRSADLPPHY